MLGKELPKELKVPKSGIDLKVSSNSEILESLEKAEQNEVLAMILN